MMSLTMNPDNLRERCLNHFVTLGIPLRAEALDTALQRTDKEALSPLAFLELVVGEQAAQRRERSTQRRIREAQFAEMKTLEAFDWNFNSQAINRAQFEELATGDFIRLRANLLVVGQAGVGKSHLIQALGIYACALGYRVLYRTSADLITDLTASLADKTLPVKLRFYSRPDWIIIEVWF